MTSLPRIFSIPPDQPFVRTLAAAIVENKILPRPSSDFGLARLQVFLPTRRACRELSNAFLDIGKSSGLLLPRIQSLGDLDDEDVSAFAASKDSVLADYPQPIDRTERLILLTRLVRQWADDNQTSQLANVLRNNTVHAWSLAQSLGQLVDLFEGQNKELASIEGLFDGEFAAHREQLTELLAIVRVQLVKELADQNRSNPVAYRTAMMAKYVRSLQQHAPHTPVIVAGSTASQPATADFMATISALSNSAVILPGLDTELDAASWSLIEDNHPQYGLKQFLSRIDVTREEVRELNGEGATSQASSARFWLASEIMRPAESSERWHTSLEENRDKLALGLKGVVRLVAGNERDEARQIALVMRKALADSKTASLITPDRTLARYVCAELARWHISIDDSAGRPLSGTPPAIFMQLILGVVTGGISATSLKSLLHHPLATFGLSANDHRRAIAALEIAVLREKQQWQNLTDVEAFLEGFDAYKHNMQNNPYVHCAVLRISDEDWDLANRLLTNLVRTLKPLERLLAERSEQRLETSLSSHIEVAETASHDENANSHIWLTPEGGELSDCLRQHLSAGHQFPELGTGEYSRLFRLLLADEVVREPMPQKPQLAIYGLLEARLIKSDIVILGGLNEGVWPGSVKSNTWLTRPQLRTAELPSPERRIGLSAHDFVQGFCSTETVLTHARKRDDAPAVPSRWILRLEALLSAADMVDELNDHETDWQALSQALNRAQRQLSTPAPSPCPPVADRPKTFSVSSIEKLIKNPYLFYVDKILKLRPLRALDEQAGPLERGIIMHDALDQLLTTYPNTMPAHAIGELAADIKRRIEHETKDPVQRALWSLSMIKMADWFCEFEADMRTTTAITSQTEINGQWHFHEAGNDYEVRARADRIDVLLDGSITLIDYKTGSAPSFDPATSSFSPQLILEALIAKNGGFNGIDAGEVEKLQYYKLSGGDPAGSLKTLKQATLEKTLATVEAGLRKLLGHYENADQAYVFVSSSAEQQHEKPFTHLTRANEWLHRVEQLDE